ncbi:MAG: alkaline phosphatase family protein [Acidobacteriota bacterium]|nr:alkaline phosphatase family protein [Acidobacteriota bacterium]
MIFLQRIAAHAAALLLLAGSVCSQTAAPHRMVVVISLDGFPAYSLDDPQLPIPTLRALAKSGASAKRMTTINPTVTWPNHTAMVTGVRADRHGLLFNGSAVRTGSIPMVKIDPFVDKIRMVHVPTVYDLAHRAGLTTAEVDWVAIHHAPSITWEFAEFPSKDGAIEKEMMDRGLVTANEVEQFTKVNILRRDQIWTDAAVHILQQHEPNLLLFHLLSLDSTHHSYGPKSLAGLDAMAFLDSCVARITGVIHSMGADNRTTILVVSDHGFKVVNHQIRPVIALADAGLSDGVQVIPEGGTAMVYLDPKRAATLAPMVTKTLSGIPGIDQIAAPEDFGRLDLPTPSADPQAPDLILVAKSDYAFTGATKDSVVIRPPEKTGSHGYLSSDPEMDAIFIASGNGIQKGVSLERIRNIDVAPTIAELLGLTLGGIEGRAVAEVLVGKGPGAGAKVRRRNNARAGGPSPQLFRDVQ